jgi:hypothetical protein
MGSLRDFASHHHLPVLTYSAKSRNDPVLDVCSARGEKRSRVQCLAAVDEFADRGAFGAKWVSPSSLYRRYA